MDQLTIPDLLMLIGEKEVRLVQQQRLIHKLTTELEQLKAAQATEGPSNG
jgi:hypothetical protein